jgi:hypothetical protein
VTSLASNSGQTDLPAHNEAKTKDATQSAGLAPQGLQSNFKPTWGYAEKSKQDGVLKSVGKEVLKGAMFASPLGIGLYTGYKVANHAANAWAVKKKSENPTYPSNVPVGNLVNGGEKTMNMSLLSSVSATKPTHPSNVPVGKNAVKLDTPAFESVKTADISDGPVMTYPSEKIKQAGLGRLICECCGIETQRKTYNQRFCCEDCRKKAWELSTGKKLTLKKSAN